MCQERKIVVWVGEGGQMSLWIAGFMSKLLDQLRNDLEVF